MKSRIRIVTRLGLISLCLVSASRSALAWGNAGHEIVAYIAADNLKPPARRTITKILRTGEDQLATAMAAASILPDNEFRERDPATLAWHFINLCLEDSESEVAGRCGGNCVVAKINEYADRLRRADYDNWGSDGDLAFLIHLVGDIYQPLHAATNADQGGNCVSIEPIDGVTTLHVFWDVVTVNEVEKRIDSGDPKSTARKLELRYQGYRNVMTWKINTAEEIALRSKQLARSQVYETLKLPIQTCQPKIKSCSEANREKLNIADSYINREVDVAEEQLAKAGFALASLLNSIWK